MMHPVPSYLGYTRRNRKHVQTSERFSITRMGHASPKFLMKTHPATKIKYKLYVEKHLPAATSNIWIEHFHINLEPISHISCLPGMCYCHSWSQWLVLISVYKAKGMQNSTSSLTRRYNVSTQRIIRLTLSDRYIYNEATLSICSTLF